MQEELNAYQQEIEDTRGVLKKIRLELKQVQEILRKKKSVLKGLKQEICQKKIRKRKLPLKQRSAKYRRGCDFP
ncbi:hypothetical protein HPB128_148g8 [Helicobacter pylori B128]|nr:hypothetical protein HPB128_148g8 [Helicobacter pylori B128]